eukprot:9190152-Alexandrium_andersonii.AAC.1
MAWARPASRRPGAPLLDRRALSSKVQRRNAARAGRRSGTERPTPTSATRAKPAREVASPSVPPAASEGQ